MSTPLQVLLVDDDSLVRLPLVAALEEAGFSVIEANNSIEAMAAIRLDVCAVVTDIDMPGSVNGLGLVRFLRDAMPYLGVVIISGRPVPREVSLPDGIVYLAKPIAPDRLVNVVRGVVSS